MSFESATQRLGELRALAGHAPLPLTPRALPSTSTSPGAGVQPSVQGMTVQGASFADALGEAQVQVGLPGVPASSAASAVPVLPAPAAPAMPSTATAAAGGTTVQTPYGAVTYPAGWNGGLAPVQGATMPGMFPPGGVGQRIVSLARAELGVRESPMGSNDAPRIREYREASGAEATPGPWCAYFVSHLSREAGAPIGAGGKGTGYVPTLESWGRQSGRFLTTAQGPQPGDIVIFDRNGDGLSDHTGVVESVGADGTLNTIEGNTSNMVARRTYAASSAQVRGFVRAG